MRGLSVQASRARLAELDRAAKARAEAGEVAAGVEETVALARSRGAAITGGDGPKGRAPYRRQPGLQWLAGKGRISATARLAGEKYGHAFRRARMDGAIRSTLDVRPGRGEGSSPALPDVLAHGEGTEAARRALARMRARLGGQSDLVTACDRICGEELTPREAGGDERAAIRLEAVLKVALDLLATG